jgi:hypothetical protein
MSNRLLFSKLIAWSFIVVILVFETSVSAMAQNKILANCHFKTYSLDERDTGGSTPDLNKWAYSVATLAPFLKLISPDYELKLVESGQADVSITYLVDDSWYKTAFSEKHPTILDLLASYPNSKTDQRTLTSPWLRIRMTADCKLVVVFIYNQRQIIADQAFLANVRPAVKGVVTFSNELQRDWTKQYENEVIKLQAIPKIRLQIIPKNAAISEGILEGYKLQDIAREQVAKKYPADVFWLLTHVKSRGGTDWHDFYFQAFESLRNLSKHADIVQTHLVLNIAGQYISSNLRDLNYGSILELQDVINLNKYKIQKFGNGKNE